MIKPKGFIVIFDDGQGASWPYGWAEDGGGAIEYNPKAIAFFPDRQSARTAIRISTATARLRKVQGLTVNDDFLPPGIKQVKIVPVFP